MQTSTTGTQAAGTIRPPPSYVPTPQARKTSHTSYAALARLAPRLRRNDALTQVLGWIGLGLGAAQLVAPRHVARAVGVDDDRALLVRACGAREVASGIGILSKRWTAGWVWTRVAGDAMDLALLGLAATSLGKPASRRKRLAFVIGAVAGVTALDVFSGVRQTRLIQAPSDIEPGEIDVEKSIVVNRAPEVCYRYWRDFRNFPRFMRHLEDVRIVSDKHSHWRAKAPAGATVEWDAELSVDHPNQLLAWHSIGEADVANAGTVRFEPAPGGRGTILRVELQYKPPAGKAGAMVAKLFGEEPGQQIDEDLRRFKNLIETGEIPTTEGQPSGQRGLLTRLLFRQGEQR
jgi:uncharacterized membrane protein